MPEHTALKKDPVEQITIAARNAVDRLERERDEAFRRFDLLKEHVEALAASNRTLKNENARLTGDNSDLVEHVKVLQQKIQTALRERDQKQPGDYSYALPDPNVVAAMYPKKKEGE